MQLIIIAAVAPGNALGKNGDLLFHISDDLKHFKTLTMGCPIIMGRKTFESFPRGPLPGRRNIVITRNQEYSPQGVEIAHSLKEAITMVQDATKAFIIGGGEIYKEAIPLAQELEITEILCAEPVDADTFFPDYSDWKLAQASPVMQDAKSLISYRFLHYLRNL